jgi:hypothetical protein
VFLVRKYVEGKNPSTNDPEGDVAVESDCDEVNDESPEIKGEREEKPRAVLLKGSFSAYVHLPQIQRLRL